MAKIELDLILKGLDANVREIKQFSSEATKSLKSVEAQAGTFGKALGGLKQEVAGLFVGFEAVNEVISLLGDAIHEATEGERAFKQLEFALTAAGNGGHEAAVDLEEYASALQKTTRFSDTVIIKNLAVLQSLTNLNENGLKATASAATDLAASSGKDLETVFAALTKAANGEFQSIRKLGVQFTDTGNNAQTFANILKAVRPGSAAKDLDTFGGSLDFLHNTFNSALQDFGKFIIGNKDVKEAIQEATAIIPAFTAFIHENSQAISDAISGVVKLGEIIGGVLVFSFKAAVAAVNGMLFSLTKLTEKTSELFAFFSGTDTKVGGFFTSIANGLSGVSDSFKEETVKNFDGALKSVGVTAKETAATGKGVADGFKDARGEIQKSGGALFNAAEVAKEEAKKFFDETKKHYTSLKEASKNFGLTETQQTRAQYDERIKIVQDALKLGIIKTEQEAADQILKINQELTKKLDDEQKKRTSDIASNFNLFKRNEKTGATESNVNTDKDKAALGVGIAGAAVKGQPGAVDLITKTLGSFADTIIPGIGGLVTQVAGVLAQGPEAAAAFVKGFVDGIPDIIINIVEAIPDVITALVDAVPNLVSRLVQELPGIAIKMALALIDQCPLIAVKLTIEIIKRIPEMVKGLVSGIVDAIKEAIGNIGNIFGGGGEGVFGGGGFLGLGFAEGGTVPGSAPFTDRVPAMLTPGESVIDRSLSDRLNKFLEGGGNGQQQSGPTTIILQVGQEQLASVILNLNRNGFRTS